MEETTTVAPPDGGAGAPAEPAEGAQQTAGQPPEPQSQNQPAQADGEYAAWLQSKGLTPDTEAAQKAAQMAYNSEKLMTKATQEASELKKSLTPQGQPYQPDENGYQTDPAMQEFIQDYKRDKMLNGFKESHPDWNQHESTMAEIVRQASPSGYTYGQLVNAGVIGLETIYAMAKSASPANTEQIKTQAQQEVLQTLANTQRAGGGNTHASNANPQATTEDPVTAAIRKARV